MRHCSNGHEVADGFAFCPTCGERMADPAPDPPEPPVEHSAAASLRAAADAAFANWEPPKVENKTSVPVDFRKARRWALIVVGVLVVIAIIAAVVGGNAGHGTTQTSTLPTTTPTPVKVVTHKCSRYHGATKPQSCISKTGLACNDYAGQKPNDCFTATQLRAREKAQKAHELAAARARKRAAERAAAAAKAAAAAEAAANAWHQGYLGPTGDNLDVYFKWRNDLSCADYATQGCVRLEVITENGCSYLEADSNELQSQGGPIVGDSLDNQTNVPPKTPVLMELDAD